MGQQGDRVMDSRSPCADIPLETAHRKVALKQYTYPWHGQHHENLSVGVKQNSVHNEQ